MLLNLREALSISQDRHIACLGRVLSDTEHNVKDKTNKVQPTPEIKRKSTHSVKPERASQPIKKQKTKNRELGNPPAKDPVPGGSEVVCLPLTRDLIHGMDLSGLNHLYGKELETYWEEANEEGKWYSAIVTDYKSELKQHKLIYDQGTLNESFEWVQLDEEVKKGNVRLAPKDRQSTFQIGRSEKFGEPPFDDVMFERTLKDGTIEELKWMLSKVQSKMLQLSSQIKPLKNPSTQGTPFTPCFLHFPLEETIISKIIARGNLISTKKKEMKIPW